MNFRTRFFLLLGIPLLLNFLLGCQLPLIESESYGKIVDDEDHRIDKALVWVEVYQKDGALKEIVLLTTQNGLYRFPTDVFGEQFSIRFFTENFGYQEEPITTSLDFNRIFPKKNQTATQVLYETHLAILDRISYWFQKNPEALEPTHLQTLSNFLESHFYNLATTLPQENPLRKEYLNVSSLYAAWYSRPQQIQNFPLIRLKLQELLNPPAPQKK